MHTEILFILDRSGSMESIRQAAIDGFNRFLAEQQAAPDSSRLTLLLFDDRLETPVDALPIAEALPLDRQTFLPRGSTALLDAIGTGIDGLGSRLAAMPPEKRPASVIVAILTDGHENSSRRFTWAQIADRIAHQREKYSWEFFFLGAGPDAIATADHLHIVPANTVCYAADDIGIESAKSALSQKIRASRAMKHGYATAADQALHDTPAQDLLEEEDQKRRKH